MLKSAGFSIVNIDSTVVAQAPKLACYLGEMTSNVAAAAGINTDQVSVKATTEEHMGYTGSGEGISAHAVSMITR